jgi:hypothetical protein
MRAANSTGESLRARLSRRHRPAEPGHTPRGGASQCDVRRRQRPAVEAPIGVYQAGDRNARTALAPPNANEFESMVRTDVW